MGKITSYDGSNRGFPATCKAAKGESVSTDRTTREFGGYFFGDRYDTIEQARDRVTALKDEWTVVE